MVSVEFIIKEGDENLTSQSGLVLTVALFNWRIRRGTPADNPRHQKNTTKINTPEL
jgi:hypothetical protein